MKKKLIKQSQTESGITLLTLVITIIVLLILASVATYSGVEVVKSAKLTTFTTEMKIMQTQVNDLYENYKSSSETLGKDIDGYTDAKTQAGVVFTASASGITDRTGYRYFDQETIKSLNIDGVKGEFFVNIEKRSVVSYSGFKYDGKTYYTLEQLPNGLYNVEYENKNANKPTFDTNIEKISNGRWRITISNIQYSGYINKWEVKYQKEGQNYWSTSEDLSFVVTEEGTYTIQLINNDVFESATIDVKTSLQPGGRAETTEKDNYTDGTNSATIPAGYTVSNIDGEKTIDGGLVIYEIPEGTTISNWTADADENGIIDVQENYNQFVWIPATESSYVRNTTYEDTSISTTAYTDKDYLPARIQPSISNELITNLSSEDEETKLDAEEQIGTINETAERTAVKNAGGFYISRYEAGKETVDGVDKLVSKKGANVWVSISQETAKTTAKNANSNYALCSGIQWDVTMAFVNGKLDGDDEPQTFDVTTASGSRHIDGGSVAKSGQNEADRVANIYDLEGNAFEYVAEKNACYSDGPYVYRGGFYVYDYPTSYRNPYDGRAYTDSSFHFTLYAM